MPREARVTKMWTQQKGLIPLLFLFFGAYFAWDGFVGYPRSDERFTAHQQLKDQPGEWEKLCRARGWKTQPPEKYLGPDKYREQFYYSAGTTLIGLIALIYWQTQRKTVIFNDENGLGTSRGLRIPYGDITRIDKLIWREKGFAYIHYRTGGAERKLTLDDAKHDPKGLDVILQETEDRVRGRATIIEPATEPGEAPLPPENGPSAS